MKVSRDFIDILRWFYDISPTFHREKNTYQGDFLLKRAVRAVHVGVIFLSHELIITCIFIYVRVCLFLCSAHIELGQIQLPEAEGLI